MHARIKGAILLVLITISAIAILSVPARAQSQRFAHGDVFAATGNGEVKWYRPDGSLVKTMDTGQGKETTGMTIDSAGNLYVTNFGADTVSHFDNQGNLLGTFGSDYEYEPESLLLDKDGNFYVGHAGASIVNKLDRQGNLLTQFDVETEDRGTDWIELGPDQCTLYYTSEGNRILRFDICANRQLPDFASGLPGEAAYALRLLDDGSILVADSEEIYHLDTNGNVIRSYDAPGEDCWFALNRDPDGRSFWSGDTCNGNFYKFDIKSGNLLLGPINACQSGLLSGLLSSGCLGGLTVYGELTAATVHISIGNWWIIPAALIPLLGLGGLIMWWRQRPTARTVVRPELRPGGPPSVTLKPPPRQPPKGADVTHGQPPRPPKRR